MTLKLTERDKKLLVILAVFVLIVGVGAGVLMPLLDKGQELQEKAAAVSYTHLDVYKRQIQKKRI